MRMPISRLNHQIDFGVIETEETDTLEGSIEKFVPKLTLHFALSAKPNAAIPTFRDAA